MATENVNNNDSIGTRLRDLRLKNGLTQEELADRAELSKGYISQLENDLTSPSIATLIDILTLLGSNLSEFFANYDDAQLVFTPDDYFEKKSESGSVTWIVPTAQKNAMEPIITELLKGQETDEDYPHEGEEFGYVLEGKIKVVVGSRTAIAEKGDTFYFTADKRHLLKNVNEDGDGVSRVLWVSCPPQF